MPRVLREWGVDAFLAKVAAVGVLLAPRLPGAGSDAPHALDPFGYLLFLGAAVAVVWRRRRPVLVLAVTVAAFVLYHGLGYPGPVFAVVPAVFAIYTAVSLGHRWAGVAATAVLLAGKFFGGLALADDPAHAAGQVVWVGGWLTVALVWGEVNRHRRAYLEQVEQRAVEAERGREEAAHRRADEERLRIARELHDTLTHAISVVNVQSSVAL